MTTLFDPVRVGAVEAPNRIFMAPMTRARGTRNHVPTPQMADYYAQRAGAGIIISEAIGISQQGLGWPRATGLWMPEQIAGWRHVTDRVGGNGGKILAQIWHMGRVRHPSFDGGRLPVSASATTAPDHAHTYDGKKPYVEARALSKAEILAVVEDFRRAAANAMEAGFDGVQLHGANGYLIDQFLRDSGNFRDDEYGGSIENRLRFMREATQAVADEVGADRTGIRLSPVSHDQGVADSKPQALFVAAAKALDEIGVAHIELREPPMDGTFGAAVVPAISPAIREVYRGVLVLNSDYDEAKANVALQSGVADAIAFGRPFIANPDLPYRFANKVPLATGEMTTWFSQGLDGYLDYRSAQDLQPAQSLPG